MKIGNLCGSVRSSSTAPRPSERRLLASTTLARKIALPVSPVSMKTRGQLAAQPNVWAAVLQLQRQHGNQFVQRFLRIAGSAEGDEPVTPKVEGPPRATVAVDNHETAIFRRRGGPPRARI